MRSGVPSKHWASIGEGTFVGGVWLLYWIHRLTGRAVFRICLAPVVLVHWLSRPAVRAASLQYLQRLQASQGVFARPPGPMLDKLLAVAGRFPAERVIQRGRASVRQAVQSGQGGVIVTAHLGCLELCRVMAGSVAQMKLNVLVHTKHAQAFNQVLRRLNPSDAVQLIEVSEISAPMAMLLAQKVAAGEFVAIAGDRVPLTHSKTVWVNFLGHPAPLPVGAYVLAALFKCPLFLMGCVHEPRGYGVYFETLAEQVVLPRKTRDEALQSYAQSFADALATLLRRSPYDWFNFFPFWDQPHAD